MTKKRKAGEKESFVYALLNKIFDNLKESVSTEIKEKTYKFGTKLTAMAFGFAIFLFGIFFLFVSLAFALHNYVQLDYAQTFLCVGALSMFVAAILGYCITKN